MPEGSDTFAGQSPQYAAWRPTYPKSLYDWIFEHCPSRDTAWDCATGNGQAARDIAPYFSKVFATDKSPEQLALAAARPNITYSVSASESTPFANASFDLVTVAQALHWFDYERFWPEVQRVAKPGAFFCAWGYDWLQTVPDVMNTVVLPVRSELEPFWTSQNHILWREYPNDEIRFPFERLKAPAFSIELDWSFAQLAAFMQTWSAYSRAQYAEGARSRLKDVLERSAKRFRSTDRFTVKMPISVVAGYNPSR